MLIKCSSGVQILPSYKRLSRDKVDKGKQFQNLSMREGIKIPFNSYIIRLDKYEMSTRQAVMGEGQECSWQPQRVSLRMAVRETEERLCKIWKVLR